MWLVTEAQRCPLVRAAYLGVAASLRRLCCEAFLSQLRSTLLHDLLTPQPERQVSDTHLPTFQLNVITLCCQTNVIKPHRHDDDDEAD